MILWTYLFSFLLYISLTFVFVKKRNFFKFKQWTTDTTFYRLWVIWCCFVLVLAPLTYLKIDMLVWMDSMNALVSGKLLPYNYVYLPIYAQFLSALYLPFYILRLNSPLLESYIIKLPVLLSYILSARFMAEMIPEHKNLAPIGIILAPMVIFNLFWGRNDIIMFIFLLISLMLLKNKKWFYSGIFASLSCYKFLLLPTIIVLNIIILQKYGRKKLIPFIYGGIIALIPSFIYYFYDPIFLSRLFPTLGSVGGWSKEIHPMHFFYFLKEQPGFKDWYFGSKIWFWLSISGMIISIILLLSKRLTSFQALGFCSAIVGLFNPENFLLEPTIGILWMDSVYRKDLRSKTAIFITLFIHTAVFFPYHNFYILSIAEKAPLYILDYGRGLYFGISIIYMLYINLISKNKEDLLHQD